MYWVIIGLAVGAVGAVIIRSDLNKWRAKAEIASTFFIRAGLTWLNTRYQITTAAKHVSEHLDIARICYTNHRGLDLHVNLPFSKHSVSGRRHCKVILVLEDESVSWMAFQDVTHEPGLEYVCSPKDLGGLELRVYKGIRWNEEINQIPPSELLAYKVSNDETLPRGWK
jgi:hypothetical protein